MNYTRLGICVAFTLLVFGAAEGQAIRLPYRHFTPLDGLAQQQVTSLLQDSRGYIWIGTKHGVSKFDGENFENFDLNALADIKVACNRLQEDALGNIYAFCTGGVARYDGRSWKRISRKKISECFKIDGEIYAFSGYDLEFWRMTPDSSWMINSFTPEQLATDAPLQLSENPIGLPIITSLGPGSDTVRCFWLNIDGQRVKEVKIHYEAPRLMITGKNAYQLCFFEKADNQGKYLLRGFKEAINLNPVIFEGEKEVYPLNNTLLSWNQNEWYLVNEKLFHRRPHDEIARRIHLPISFPTVFMEDRDGALWIGSETGLYQYFPDGFRYIDEHKAPLIWSIVEDASGKMWMGSYSSGLFTFDGEEVGKMPLPGNLIKSHERLHFYNGACRDRDGALYFPTIRGLISYDRQRFENLNARYGYPQKTVLISKYDESRNQVLIAGYNGLFAYEKSFKSMRWIYHQPDPNYIVRGLTLDRNHNYWIASNHDVVRVDAKSNAATVYSDRTNLPFHSAYCIETDTEAGLWFGATQGGLYYFDEQSEQFRRIAPEVIQRAVVSLLVVDSLLVIGELGGIFVLNLNAFHGDQKEHIWVFNQLNGFTGIEPNQNSLMLDSKGFLWAVASNQVAFIHKSRLLLPDQPSQVRITQINQQRIPYTHTGPLPLPYGENDLIVRFESIGAQRTFKTLYSWRLIGEKEMDWSAWSEQAIAFIPQLPGGKYTLEVRSKHPATVGSSAYRSDKVSFEIRIAFIKGPTFVKVAIIIPICLLLLMFVVFWYYRKERKRAQHALEKELAQEMKASQLAIAQSETEKKLLDRERAAHLHQIRALQSQLKPHFIFNLLNSLKKSIVVGNLEEADERLDSMANLLRLMLETSVESNPDNPGKKAHLVSLKKEIDLIEHYVKLMGSIQKDKFTWSIEVDPDLLIREYLIPPMIIQPFVENAIKHGLLKPGRRGDGHLLVRFSQINNGIHCLIQDGGIGMTNQASKTKEKQKSYGIQLIKDRIRLLHELNVHVELDINANPKGGVEVSIGFWNNP